MSKSKGKNTSAVQAEDESRKEKKIDLSLKEVAHQLAEMEEEYQSQSKKLPASARYIEKRVLALHKEMDETSDKMLAYKLKRIADSKMLKKVSEYESSTFKCKSDLDLCLLSSKSALDKALCFTLFIRCAIKG